MNKLLHLDHDRNVVLFIGKNVYKLHQGCLGSSDCLMAGYPRPINEEFSGGPRKVTAAAYVPDNRKRTYLIKGQRVFTVYIDLLILPLKFNAPTVTSPVNDDLPKNSFFFFLLK